MASLKNIRKAIEYTIETAVSGIRIYDTVADVTEAPAGVIEPQSGNFYQAMGRGHDEWIFNLYVLVPKLEYSTSQHQLDAYVTGAGDKSIREAIFYNKTLGLNDGTSAYVSSLGGYGGHFELAGLQHVGAVLQLTVLTPGTA